MFSFTARIIVVASPIECVWRQFFLNFSIQANASVDTCFACKEPFEYIRN